MNSTNGNEYLYLVLDKCCKMQSALLQSWSYLLCSASALAISCRYCHINMWACIDHYQSGGRAQEAPEYSLWRTVCAQESVSCGIAMKTTLWSEEGYVLMVSLQTKEIMQEKEEKRRLSQNKREKLSENYILSRKMNLFVFLIHSGFPVGSEPQPSEQTTICLLIISLQCSWVLQISRCNIHLCLCDPVLHLRCPKRKEKVCACLEF